MINATRVPGGERLLDDGLRDADALPVAFGEFGDQGYWNKASAPR
jgi:hypothetical protein